MSKTRLIAMLVAAGAVIGAVTWRAYSHCQIPCGIYDDQARLAAIREHTRTIEKSMLQINVLGAAEKPNYNQLIRWVGNKERHADYIAEIVTQYFMAQRIKPAAPADPEAHKQYVTKLTLLHRMLVAAMKAKQTTDKRYVSQLDELLAEFATVYQGKARKR